MTELKPCPFCGSLSYSVLDHDPDCYMTVLHERVNWGKYYTHEEQTASWNMRYEPTCENLSPDDGQLFCSNCGGSYPMRGTILDPVNYCPGCGYKLEEVEG